MDLKTPKKVAKRTAYVAIGAPVVVGRKAKEMGSKVMGSAQTHIDDYANEGEKVTKQLKDRNVVEELEHRMNIDKVQDRVEQLRDQLETTLTNWRESFAPETEKKVEEPKKEAKKAPAKKAPAKKAPAKKASATKTTAKKAPAKEAPAKKAPAKKPTAEKETAAAE